MNHLTTFQKVQASVYVICLSVLVWTTQQPEPESKKTTVEKEQKCGSCRVLAKHLKPK